MSKRGILRGLIACAVALALPATTLAPAFSATAASGSFTGRVYGNSGSPVPEAKVWLRSLDSGEERTSDPTASDGAYSFRSLPRARYEVAVETPAGFYVVTQSMELGGESNQSYIFRLKDATPEETQAALQAWAKEEDDDKKAPPPDPTSSTPPPGSRWVNPLTVLFVGIALVSTTYLLVDEARSKDEQDQDLSPKGP